VIGALSRLNSLTDAAAAEELLKCCASSRWAERLAKRRPFQDLAQLTTAADELWWDSKPQDWLEAFAHHPRIGEKPAANEGGEETRRWSEQEQSGTRGAARETRAELARANREYERKFGYIFIVCATGKSSDEMLAMLRMRLENDPASELRVAASEQSRITQLRLKKLLDR
jgi:OHCU decarboxylase